MIDLDHFKRFNDTFGHAAADVVLRETAALIRASLNGEDIACRYGGEELVVILPDTTREQAVARADAMRIAIAEQQVQYRGAMVGIDHGLVRRGDVSGRRRYRRGAAPFGGRSALRSQAPGSQSRMYPTALDQRGCVRPGGVGCDGWSDERIGPCARRERAPRRGLSTNRAVWNQRRGEENLVVDDSKVIRKLLGIALTQAGYEIIEAVDGIDGSEKMGSHKNLAMVICDVDMPRMNGINLLSKTVQGMPDAPPFLMLTTDGQPKLISRAREAGANGWLMKPIKEDLLIIAVQTIAGDA